MLKPESIAAFGCFVFCFVVTAILMAQERKLDPSTQTQRVGIGSGVYEYKGLKRGSDQLWMAFEVFTSDQLRHEEIWVPPWALRVTAQNPKSVDDGTWLTWRLEEGRGYAAEAWLRVSSANAKEAWDKYLKKLKEEFTFRYQPSADELTAEFEKGVGILVIVRPKNYGSSWGESGSYATIAKISAPLDHASVVIDKTVRGVEVVVDWGLAQIKEEVSGGCGHSSSVMATKLEIHVQNGTVAEYWEKKLLEWREKLKPHIVLPPTDSK